MCKKQKNAPKNEKKCEKICTYQKKAVPLHAFSLRTYVWRRKTRDVAQSGSATVWGTGGRKFKSCHPDKSFDS